MSTKKLQRIRATQMLRWGVTLMIFVAVNAVLRLALMPINEAEYTDGILQLTQFENPTGIYPPLYTALCWPLFLVMGELWAGRLVSTVFGTAGVVPIFLLAQRCFGTRPAIFAALIYTVAPTNLRWSPRVMTDSMFAFFFWFACERLIAAQGAKTEAEANRALLWASLLGGLAALTRYQGLLLLPPVLGIALYLWRTYGFVAWKGCMALAIYAFVPLWSWISGNIHANQFEERTAALGAPLTLILIAESFILYMPYWLTYPVAWLVMLGMNKGRARPRYAMMPLTIYVFSILLVAQSLFASFQERYMLPVFGLLYVWGGLGMAIADHMLRRRAPRLRPYVPILTVAWSLFIAAFVLLGSREAWGDIRKGAVYAADYKHAHPEAMIYTNESYREGITSSKVVFFSKQPVFYLSPEFVEMRIRLKAGDLLVLSSIYGPHAELLGNYYDLELLSRFQSSVTPIFSDLMAIPQTDQSPIAWNYRYVPQPFETRVYVVRGMKRPGGN